MGLMEKLEQSIGKINSRYDISPYEVEEVRKSMSNPVDGICMGFRYGYLQGMKAAEAKLKEKPEHEPKYKNELRQAIYYQVSHIKNVYVLRCLLQIADIFRRRHDEEEYKTLTELEWEQAHLVSGVLRCDDEKCIRHVRFFMDRYSSNSVKRKAGAIS